LTSGGNNFNDFSQTGDGTSLPGGGATTLGRGTVISGGGTSGTGGGTSVIPSKRPFLTVSTGFNHWATTTTTEPSTTEPGLLLCVLFACCFTF